MHPLLLYAIKVISCSGILVGYYWFGLRNKVFHHYNRFYLLAAVVLSLCLPLIKINFWQQQQNTTNVFKLLQAVNTDHETLNEIVLTNNTNAINWEQVSLYLYAAIVAVLLLFFLKTLATIYFIYRRHEKASAEDITLIQTEAKGTPFSFFQLIFWNIHIDLQSLTGKRILQHEIAHVQQKHSYDKIFINLVLIACWCNPFFWLIRKELNMIHEFTADQQAVKDHDTTAFAAMILQATYPQHRFDITNQFFYSPIKRRLMMLTKNNHTKAGYISRIMVLPLAALVFVAFTFKAKTFSPAPFKGKKITVVIDAGHGGKDFGASDGNGTYEKDLSLAIAQKIKALNSNSDIDIVLTRETDVYQTPPEKADFINGKKADLAISVHIDAIDKDSANFRSGISFWVSKNESNNSQGSKVLASSIIQSFSNEQIGLPLLSPLPLQINKGVWILKATNCPTVLIEAGFITNKKDLAFLKTGGGKEAIAKRILDGLNNYLNNKETAVSIDTIPGLNTARQEDAVPTTVLTYESDTTEIDLEKALMIYQGKIIARKKMDKEMLTRGGTYNIKWLKPEMAIAKYGEQAKYGACETTLSYETKLNNSSTLSKEGLSDTVPGKHSPKNLQTKNNNSKNHLNELVFTKVENEAEFPGGDAAWARYIQKNQNEFKPATDGAPAGTYSVMVRFIVYKDGSISDIVAETKHGYGLENHAINCIKKGPKWIPATQNGHDVNAYRHQPVTYVVEEGSK